MASPVVGVDFDNTLVRYDDLIHRIAVERGLVPAATAADKIAVRDQIRTTAGNDAWQRVQADVYGPRIGDARLHEGVAAFFRACRRAGTRVYVVSHKTKVAAIAPHGVNLRQAATGWMAEHGFFAAEGLGLAEADVFFEPTRAAKVERIAALGCTHFIDDLDETFAEPGFPAGVVRILFAPHGSRRAPVGVHVARSWDEITTQVLGG